MKNDADGLLYVADMAFVGLGLSNTMTFLNFLGALIDEPPLHTMRVLLIERHPVHFTGIAYGPRSGPNSLIITTLEEFIGADERREFIDWIRKNESWLFDDFERCGGKLSAQWLQAYHEADEDTLETNLCVPRMFFGHFLREQVFSMITLATVLDVVDVQTVTGEVRDIDVSPLGYSLDIEGHDWLLLAEKIVLGVGLPPARKLACRDGMCAAPATLVIDNPYEKSIGELTVELAKTLTSGKRCEPLDVLIIGSNASAIESAYLLFDQPGFEERVNKVRVLSPAGRFPNRRLCPVNQPDFDPIHLRQLLERPELLAEDIFRALERDLAGWKKRLDVAELPVFSPNREMLEAVNRLSREEKHKFASVYGVMIGKFQRRAGDEYLNMADAMASLGKLEHIAGRFVEIISADEAGSLISYVPNGATEALASPQTYSLIINCMGPQTLQDQKCPLIGALLRRGICQMNSSGRGFVVGDDYTAAPNLIVTGPLISGNVIRDQAVWHVEHCGRLTAIGKDVAAMLHSDIVETLYLAA